MTNKTNKGEEMLKDKSNKNQNWSDEAHDVLVLAIQTLDSECFEAIQDYKNPIGNLRHRVDLVLNSDHWRDKRCN